jgi:hypothetical protein
MSNASKTVENCFSDTSLSICANCKYKTTDNAVYRHAGLKANAPKIEVIKVHHCRAVKIPTTMPKSTDQQLIDLAPHPLCRDVATTDNSCELFAEKRSAKERLSLILVKLIP